MPLRFRAGYAAAAFALTLGATLIALPDTAHAVTAPTAQVIGPQQLSAFDPGGTAAPATSWWVDTSRTSAGAQVDLQNVTPGTGLDGSLWLQMPTSADTAAVDTLTGAGIPVSGITAASYVTRTSDATAVPVYEVTVRCASGAGTLRLTYDPHLFGNGTVTANTWQTWDAAAGKWWLDQDLDVGGVPAPAGLSTPGSILLAGGPGNGYTLGVIGTMCAGTGNGVVSHGVAAGPGWASASDTYADLVTFNGSQADFLYDVAVRLSGADRYQTALDASGQTFADGSADGVVLARGDLFADALSGVPLAGAYGGPLLLTPQNQLLPAVLVEIKRVLAPTGTVFLMGGTGALSDTVEAALVAGLPGHQVQRVAGTDRYATAVAGGAGGPGAGLGRRRAVRTAPGGHRPRLPGRPGRGSGRVGRPLDDRRRGAHQRLAACRATSGSCWSRRRPRAQ